MKLFRLNLKIIFSSVITCVYFFFNLFFFVFFLVVLHNSNFINYAVFLDSLAYYEVAMFILSFCLAIYFSHMNYFVESICFVSRCRYIVARFFTTLFTSYLLIIIPVLYIIISSFFEKTEFTFNALSLIYFVCRWIAILSISVGLGYLIGTIVERELVYLLSIPFAILFSHLNKKFFSLFLSGNTLRKVSTLFSLQKPFVDSADIEYFIPRVDFLFFVKQIIVLVFFVFIVSVILFVSNTRLNIKIGLLQILSLAVLSQFCHLYISAFPVEYDCSNKLYAFEEVDNGYKIRSYNGDIHLSDTSLFHCTLNIERGRGDLTIRLDKAFTILNIQVNEKEVNYSQIDDYIIFKEKDLPVSSLFEVRVSYRGMVQYISDSNCVNIYTSFMSSALPPNFAFIPIIDGDRSEKNYEFIVDSQNTLISNLTVEAVDGSNTYRVSGSSSSFCLFSGFLEEMEQDGITFYRAKYNKTTDYWAVYQNSLSYPTFDPYHAVFSEIPPVKPEKVFMIYYLYGVVGYPVVFDNYTMLNYGFAAY